MDACGRMRVASRFLCAFRLSLQLNHGKTCCIDRAFLSCPKQRALGLSNAHLESLVSSPLAQQAKKVPEVVFTSVTKR